MSAGELYDVCVQASAAVPWYQRRRLVLWLTSPYVQVGHRRWKPRRAHAAASGTGTVWGYSAGQATRIASALLPVMAAHARLAERYAEGAAAIPPAPPQS